MTNFDTLIREKLSATFPNDWATLNADMRMQGRVSFGYIGNCGVDRSGAYDDRSWGIFVATSRGSQRVGSYKTQDLATCYAALDTLLIPAVRRLLEGN